MNKCKECGREEWGFLSVLNDDGYCPNCAMAHYGEKIKKLQEQLNEANNLFLKIQNKLEDEPEEGTMTETRIYGLIDDYLTKWVGKDWWMKNDI